MHYNPDNPFAKILRGEAPCIKVYEDESTLAIMDIMPQAEGHVLVIPKQPAVTIFELSPEAAAACIKTAQKVGRAVLKAVGAPGLMLVQVNGAAAGQTVPHVHFHILPRTGNDTLRPHASIPAPREELEQLAQRITAQLEA